uniref:Uncharacterized protein n=2 Tax=Fopius arisanus TaxID=64838 RepID=A0A0C9RT69_9HYME
MNSIVFGFAGSVLALSSLLSFFFLMKRNSNRCITSSLSILITSDILSSILISIILFYNQYKGIMLQGTERSPKKDIMNLLKTINGTNEQEHEMTNCDSQIILMNYSLFMIPFANSFISLLSMSIQCNYNVEMFYRKCKNFMNLGVSHQTKETLFTNIADRNNTVTVVSVTSQWMIPILSAMILLFSGYEKSMDIDSVDMTCTFTTNFPFESCYFDTKDDSIEISNSTRYLLADQHNYINELALEKFQPNSSASDEIVSKVYSIVESALSSSGVQVHRPEQYYDVAELSNVTSFMKTPHGENGEDEVNVFDDLMKNESVQYIINTSTESGMNNLGVSSITATKSTNTTTDAEILKDIVQKIYSTKFKIKNRVRPQLVSKGRSYMDTADQILVVDTSIGIDGRNLTVSTCMKNQCIISVNFLKIHLFLLMIFIYFGPILASTILHMRSHYVCSNVLEKLEMSGRIESSASTGSNSSSPSKPSNFGWLGAQNGQAEEGEISNDKVQEIKRKVSSHSMKNPLVEMEKLSSIFRKSLISGVALWTPMFLVVLIKVFLCSDLPTWLLQFFYLVAISFGAVRNYFNLAVWKSSEILMNGFRKKNIVHPTSESLASGSK